MNILQKLVMTNLKIIQVLLTDDSRYVIFYVQPTAILEKDLL